MDCEVSSSPFGLGRECMSVTFHSPREKVYNKICSFVALYTDFCVSAVNLKLSITEIYANRLRLSATAIYFPNLQGDSRQPQE